MKTILVAAFLFISIFHFCNSKVTFNVEASKLFVVPLHYSNFSNERHELEYSARILGMPDLPSWMHTAYSNSVKMGFLFGVPPPKQVTTQIEVTARNKQTYKTQRQIINLQIAPHKSWNFNLVLKISNLNIDELLVGSRYLNLLRVVSNDLWNNSGDELDVPPRRRKRVGPDFRLGGANLRLEDMERRLRVESVVVTGIVSATHMGDRVPLLPHHKEGTYISFGSDEPFSAAMLRLEREVSILHNRAPCPTYFKKTSYERYFRSKSFSIDWCSFRMYEKNESGLHRSPLSQWSPEPHNRQEDMPSLSDVLGDGLKKLLPLTARDQVPHHDYMSDVVHTVLVPVAVLLLLLSLLTAAMCCNTDASNNSAGAFLDDLIEGFPSRGSVMGIRPPAPSSPRPPPTQAAPLLHQSVDTLNTSRQQCSEAENTFDATGYNDSEFDHSIASDEQTGDVSPDLSLRRHDNRKFEDYATLTRPAPPPYSRGSSCSQFEE